MPSNWPNHGDAMSSASRLGPAPPDRDNGVTYNVYADPQGTDRPWELDPLPLIIPDEEWRQIEAGRGPARALLNALLADLYGPQRLLREGLVPAALVFGHPGFLRP